METGIIHGSCRSLYPLLPPDTTPLSSNSKFQPPPSPIGTTHTSSSHLG